MTITITSHPLLSMKDTTLGEAGTVSLGGVRIRARETYVHCGLIVAVRRAVRSARAAQRESELVSCFELLLE
jgi:hypothetical protein